MDERAEDVSGSLLTALIADSMLEREPGAKIVYNVICSKTVPEVDPGTRRRSDSEPAWAIRSSSR